MRPAAVAGTLTPSTEWHFASDAPLHARPSVSPTVSGFAAAHPAGGPAPAAAKVPAKGLVTAGDSAAWMAATAAAETSERRHGAATPASLAGPARGEALPSQRRAAPLQRSVDLLGHPPASGPVSPSGPIAFEIPSDLVRSSTDQKGPLGLDRGGSAVVQPRDSFAAVVPAARAFERGEPASEPGVPDLDGAAARVRASMPAVGPGAGGFDPGTRDMAQGAAASGSRRPVPDALVLAHPISEASASPSQPLTPRQNVQLTPLHVADRAPTAGPAPEVCLAVGAEPVPPAPLAHHASPTSALHAPSVAPSGVAAEGRVDTSSPPSLPQSPSRSAGSIASPASRPASAVPPSPPREIGYMTGTLASVVSPTTAARAVPSAAAESSRPARPAHGSSATLEPGNARGPVRGAAPSLPGPFVEREPDDERLAGEIGTSPWPAHLAPSSFVVRAEAPPASLPSPGERPAPGDAPRAVTIVGHGPGTSKADASAFVVSVAAAAATGSARGEPASAPKGVSEGPAATPAPSAAPHQVAAGARHAASALEPRHASAGAVLLDGSAAGLNPSSGVAGTPDAPVRNALACPPRSGRRPPDRELLGTGGDRDRSGDRRIGRPVRTTRVGWDDQRGISTRARFRGGTPRRGGVHRDPEPRITGRTIAGAPRRAAR